MNTLVRELIIEDVPKITQLLEKVFDDGTYREVHRLGGMTNHSYKITRNDGKEYLVRIPGEGTTALINRSDERKSTELACSLGIDTKLLYFGDDGSKIMEFIPGSRPMTEQVMRQKDTMHQAARILRKLHTCGVDTGVPFEIFEMAQLYERIIHENAVSLYDDYNKTKEAVTDIKVSVDATGIAPKVPCHNDPLIGNWVISRNGTLFLIDWEYSGMNEAMWDLSCLSIEANYSKENDKELLSFYYGRESEIDEQKRFIAAKIYVDYLWTLWGLTRVPYDGDFMQQYADTRYARLKGNITAYETLGFSAFSI